MAEISRSRLIIIIVAALLTLSTLLITIFSLKSGVVDVYPYLYIVPVILVAYEYPRSGVYFTIILGWLYLGLVYFYGAFNVQLLASSSVWFYVFVSLGVLISAYTNEIVRQRKYLDIFVNSQSGIFTFDLESQKIQQHNARLDHILGYESGDLDNREISILWDKPDVMHTLISRIRQDRAVNDAEIEFVKKDGSRVWAQVTASLTVENLVVCFVADISERKNVSDKLRESEVQYQLLFDQAGDAIVIHNMDGIILDANKIACQSSGYSLDELKKMRIMDLGISPCAERTRANIKEMEVKGSLIYETIHRNRFGSEIPTEISSSRIDYHGHPAVICIIRDISERKRAETSIREREQRFRMTGELIPYGVWICDASGQFTYCSESFLALIGMKQEDCKNHAWMRQLSPEDAERTKNDWMQTVQTGGFWDYEYRIFDKTGQEHFILSRGSPIRDSSGKITSFVGIHLDITDRRQYENQLETSVREKEVIIKEVHHRVKNNMQVISGFLQLQTNYIKDPESAEKLEECQRRVRSMALVHEKLYQSKHLGFINVAEYLKSLTSELQESYVVQTEVKFEVDVENININLDTAIPCGLIINELLTNSLKYAFKGRSSGTLGISLHLSPDHRFTLKVSDNGTGLPKNFDLKSTATLGMQLVQVLVRQLGGEITITSQQGTTFTITFPEKF
ncbi:MAG: PAS domain S-box protein [Methanoregula sp.]